MKLQELSNLETQVDQLINFINELKEENGTLRSQLSESANQSIPIKSANQQAVQKIKQLIKQLKEETHA